MEADNGTPRKSFSHVRDCHFVQAIETLQQIKTTFTPFEKLDVLLETFREINRTGQATCGRDYSWSMDELFPVFQYIVVRARILQLGAEIHMIEDLTQDSCLRNGEFGIMFTTLQVTKSWPTFDNQVCIVNMNVCGYFTVILCKVELSSVAQPFFETGHPLKVKRYLVVKPI